MGRNIGVVTGGGHIASFNAALYAIAVRASKEGDKVVGYKGGLKGLHIGDSLELIPDMIDVNRAGSKIKSARFDLDIHQVKATSMADNLDAIIVLGGDGQLKHTQSMYEKDLPVVGWPKTMDNDLSATKFSMGFITAVDVGVKTVYYAHVNASEYGKVHFITAFGRNTDWVAGALATWGCADLVIGNEHEYSFDEVFHRVSQVSAENYEMFGEKCAVVVVGEYAKIHGLEGHYNCVQSETDKDGYLKADPNALSSILANAFRQRGENAVSMQAETYNMRDFPPSENDKYYSALLAERCYDLIIAGEFGQCAIINDDLTAGSAPLEDVSRQRKLKPEGFINYESMTVKDAFTDYYKELFGSPRDKTEALGLSSVNINQNKSQPVEVNVSSMF